MESLALGERRLQTGQLQVPRAGAAAAVKPLLEPLSGSYVREER